MFTKVVTFNSEIDTANKIMFVNVNGMIEKVLFVFLSFTIFHDQKK